MKSMIGNNLPVRILTAVIIFAGIFLLGAPMISQKEPEKSEANFYEAFQLPETLSFAGEDVPLEYFDVRESLDREILVNSYFHSQTLRYLKTAPRFFSIIEPLLKDNSIHDDFKYLALAESGFDTRAVSPSGAVGVWQFMRGTAVDYGLEISPEVDERYHLEKSTHAACAYLHDSFERYGNWTIVAASFNAGQNRISRQIERQKESNYYNLLLNNETSRYIFRILSLKLVMENPEKYGFKVEKEDIYPQWNTKTIKVSGKIESMADFAKLNGTNYKILKLLNPWLRDAFLNNKKGKTYEIKIPGEGFRTNTN